MIPVLVRPKMKFWDGSADLDVFGETKSFWEVWHPKEKLDKPLTGYIIADNEEEELEDERDDGA